jgi:hypothetical protein
MRPALLVRTWNVPELAPTASWRQLVVHLAQWEGDELPGSFDELLAAEVEYEEADLTSWRQRVAGLQEVTDRLDLFAKFSDIEDAFESFEERIMALDLRIDLEIQREVDVRRGK